MRTPDAIAMISGAAELRYDDLERQVSRLAHRLRAYGAGPDTLVGVSLPRSPELVIAILAVLRAGAAYLPLDPHGPAARLANMVDDARPALLITREDLAIMPATDAKIIDVSADAD